MKDKIKAILITVSIPVIGYLSSFFFNPINFYADLNKPMLAPPSIVFPIAWTILYTLLGLYLYSIIKQKNLKLISIYSIQMIINLLWSIVFFNYFMFNSALIMIVVMFALTFAMILIDKGSKYKYVLIPYMLWLCFAFYLNLSIIILN